MRAVELNDVTFSYDGKTDVLKGVNFFAEYGEVSLVAGHSGEGKSTLMSIIGGIIPNVTAGTLSGETLVAGKSIKGERLGEVCRKVGVVLQNADEQIIHKRVDDEIAFGCENLAFPPDKIERQINIVCNLLGLKKDWATRSLSGGQKQRLITASTLAMGQKIIILDEPLANLDKAGAAELMRTLRSLAGAGYAVIIVEHRLDMVLPFVDRAWHISGGKAEEVKDKNEYLLSQSIKIADGSEAFVGEEKLLSLSGVGFKVKEREILKDVSFDVLRGERVVLLGENGTGKTTLLRIIARLIKPSSGRVTQYISPDLKQKTRGCKKWFKSVGVVYQNPDYQLFMPTVQKEIEFGAASKEYAAEIGELFGLTKLFSRHPQSLSEGQKRLVSIAAVCAAKPKLLLLDEPTVGQDYNGLKNLVKILNELHDKEKNAVISVTHDVRCAAALCDKAILIKNGSVSSIGGKELVESYFALD